MLLDCGPQAHVCDKNIGKTIRRRKKKFMRIFGRQFIKLKAVTII